MTLCPLLILMIPAAVLHSSWLLSGSPSAQLCSNAFFCTPITV